MKQTIGAASALALLAGAASAQETTLRGVTSFAEGTTFSRPFERFIERVSEQCEEITIDYVGGPSAMPPFEVGNAVQTGVVDIANVTSAYYSNLLPEGEALKLSELTIQEQRANGAWEYINDLHNEKMNAWYLARTGDGVPFHLYLTEAIETPDLAGLTLRTTPVYRAFFTALGASLVQTPPGEVYTALERGVVQGYGWPIQGVLDLGWQEVTNYRVDPGFYNVDVNILVNLDRWNGLTDAQRDCLTEQAIWIEGTNAENAGINEAERQRQAEAGIETIAFTGEDRETWLETAQSAGWAYVYEVVDRETAARLEELLTE